MKKRSPQELNHIAASWEMREGVLVWKRNANGGKKIGDPVGLTTLKSGHTNCFLTHNGKLIGYSVGQVAWFLYTGQWADGEIDHKDCNPQNNVFKNLRLADRSEQCRNRVAGRKGRVNKGVYKRDYGNKWSAQIWVNKRCIHLGTFDSEDEAVEVRELAADMLHGEFANKMSYASAIKG
jgi:hypothetical protein